MVTLDDIRAAAQRIAGARRAHALRAQPHAVAPDRRARSSSSSRTCSSPPRSRSAARSTSCSSLDAAERKRGVIAMSAGNHAQARRLPRGAPRHPGDASSCRAARRTPRSATPRCTAPKVVLEGENLFEAGKHARTLAARDNLVFVHPYEDPLIIAGQGTVALEMLEAVPDLEVLVVPVGGGGLISGIATAAQGAEARHPGLRRRVEELSLDAPAPERPAGRVRRRHHRRGHRGEGRRRHRVRHHPAAGGGSAGGEGGNHRARGGGADRDREDRRRGRGRAPRSPRCSSIRRASPASASACRSRAATSTAACSPRC